MSGLVFFGALALGATAKLTPEKAEQRVRADDAPVTFLQELCDDHGGRLSGSPANEAAMQDLEAALRALGLEPEREWFEMPGWERGPDRVKMLSPAERELRVAALGYVGPSELFAGPVVDLGRGSEEDFDREFPEGAFGMFGPSASGRPNTVTERAVAAGLKGLFYINRVGGGQVLARTGGFHGEPLPLPVFSITQEEGFWMRRRLERGEPVTASIEVKSRRLPDRRLANLHLRFPGESDETILVGAHFDSWDLGQGAIDNGLGVAQLFALARVLKDQPLKRSVELVWFNGEEQGLFGSRHAAGQLGEAGAAPLVMINLDMVGVPIGVNALGDKDLLPALERWHDARGEKGALEKGVENKNWMASDHTPYQLAGVRAVTFNAPIPEESVRYYHDFGDTWDKLTPELIKDSAAIVASLVVGLAEDPDLPTGLRSERDTERLFKKAKLDGRLKAVKMWPFDD
ncbi:M28 family peptidase [Actomonas aquatica]|uniref:Carboxypeptidase Q n=1 Tax=Actomonas aquatica TaxID=2866162 RepID=A0ABZ1CD25_9BACT|nr:M28 family peptidase [Opitutus sp. WL0086]WRQ89576.1 M28 family peptidase [Opitutus sp. WL0086]